MSDTGQSQFHRLFVALSVPEVVKSEIRKAQNELREALPGDSVRWTRSEHFHLTLRFLGNVTVERVGELGEELRRACRDFAPLQLRAERLGFFPERGFPRVIWTSVSNQDQQLLSLQNTIQSTTQEFTAEPAEKQFTGHITLGRAKRIGRREADTLTNFAEKMRQRFFGQWTADTVELFKSELLPDGAQHTLVATISLGRAK
jgi:RNA 2',3'-cyclic 3'-phosphodiesterase